MTQRRTVTRRSFLAAASVLTAVVAAGCVAAPGSSAGSGSSTAPGSTYVPGGSQSPGASPTTAPTPSTPPPPTAPAGSRSPDQSASAAPSTATCGVATWSTGANDLVLRLTLAGGFVPPGVDQTSVPVVSVYGDGRVISPGPQIAIYPGPLLPSLQVQVLTAAGMRALLDAAARAGLLVPDITYESRGIADAPTSFFTLIANGCTHHVNAYALSESDNTTGLDQQTIEARAMLLAFRNALSDLPTLVGAANVADGGPFAPTSYRIVSREQPPATGASPSPAAALTWPLKTPLAIFGAQLGAGLPDVRCGIADGADATALTPLFHKANSETPWVSAGRTYSLRVRPLLPDEQGCDAPLV